MKIAALLLLTALAACSKKDGDSGASKKASAASVPHVFFKAKPF